MIKTCLYQAAIAACLFLTACNESKTTDGVLAVIPLGAAFDTPVELKASDGFKKISYIPLETNDSCLIGHAPSVKILHDKLLVTTAMKQCFLFDRATGRFLTSVGHVGNDPEGYSDVRGCWVDYPNNLIYFNGWNGSQVIYNADGTYKGNLKSPLKATEFPSFTVFNYLDEQTLVAHSTAGNSNPDQVTVFRDTTIINQFLSSGMDTVSFKMEPENIQSLSVIYNHGFGGGMIFLDYKDGKAAAYPIGDRFFWHQGKDLFFMEQFNDTIYQVTADALLPVRYLDLASYHWDAAERFNKEQARAIYPTEVLEGKDVLLIRFVVDLYKDRFVYNALFDKKNGTVKVSNYTMAFKNDLDGFLPLQPEFVSPDGEFAQIIPVDEIISWFEENGDKAGLPEEVAALKQVGEEDNPVVVIMQ